MTEVSDEYGVQADLLSGQANLVLRVAGLVAKKPGPGPHKIDGNILAFLGAVDPGERSALGARQVIRNELGIRVHQGRSSSIKKLPDEHATALACSIPSFAIAAQ